MYIGKQPVVGNFQVCDAITVVNGQAAYTMQVSSANVEPENANHMLVSLNGILQKPGSSFTISGATITFASNLATGDSIDFIILLGNVLDIGTPSDGVVTNAKLAQDIISGETALAAIPATTDEFLISDAGTLKRIDAQFFQNTPAFRVKLSADQNISNATWTKITFDTETIDSDGKFASNKFTPTVAGTYFLGLQVTIDDLADTKRLFTQIYKNGSAMGDSLTGSGSGVTEKSSNSTMIIDTADSDDYYEGYVYHDIGSTQELRDDYSTIMFGYKLIGI